MLKIRLEMRANRCVMNANMVSALDPKNVNAMVNMNNTQTCLLHLFLLQLQCINIKLTLFSQ